MDTEFSGTSQMTIKPNSSHIRAAKLSNTRKVTDKSTKKGLVTRNTAKPAIIRFLTVSFETIAYCSKNMKDRAIGKASSLDAFVMSSRSESIAFFWKVELSEFFIKPMTRETSNFVPFLENFKS